MKVYIGPYKHYIGIYQLVDLLTFKWINNKTDGEDDDKFDDFREKVGTWLEARGWNKPFNWIYSKRNRNIQIRIDKYDTWNLDHTLALIIYPALVEIQKNKMGAPCIADEDVPDELKSTSCPKPPNEWDTDDNYFKRWDYVIEEMIWAFKQLIDDEDRGIDPDKYLEHHNRIENGTRLFGKYFTGLWT